MPAAVSSPASCTAATAGRTGPTWRAAAALLQNKNIVSVAARGGNLAGGGEQRHRPRAAGSTTAPTAAALFPWCQGLAAGSVFGLAADNSSSNAGGNGTRFFASLGGAAAPAANGVYLGDPTKPANWAQVLSLGADRVAKVSTGPGGSVVAAVYDSSSGNPTSGKLVGIYLSQNSGATWASMTTNLPDTNPGGQASTNLAVAIDPSNPNIVYVAGDAKRTGVATVAAFRLTLTGSTFSVELADRRSHGQRLHRPCRCPHDGVRRERAAGVRRRRRDLPAVQSDERQRDLDGPQYLDPVGARDLRHRL